MPDSDSPSPDTVQLLHRCAGGDGDARDALFMAVYQDLRRRASHYRRGSNETLSTTALVHETWLSLARGSLSARDRAHFFRIAAQAMRNVLVDAARRRNAEKRGGGIAPVTLNEATPATAPALDVIALDGALRSLAEEAPRLAEVVDLHFFVGLGFGEIADLLELSERTVGRDWRTARALLRVSLAGTATAQAAVP